MEQRVDDYFNGSGVLPTKFWECLGLSVPLLIYSQNTFDEIRNVASEKYSLPIVHDYESLVAFLNQYQKYFGVLTHQDSHSKLERNKS